MKAELQQPLNIVPALEQIVHASYLGLLYGNDWTSSCRFAAPPKAVSPPTAVRWRSGAKPMAPKALRSPP